MHCVRITHINAYDLSLLLRFKENNYTLYSSILWRLTYLNGLDALISLLNGDDTLSDQEKGDALCHNPLTIETWTKVDTFNKVVIMYYWENVRVFRLDEREKQKTCRKLILRQVFAIICIISLL